MRRSRFARERAAEPRRTSMVGLDERCGVYEREMVAWKMDDRKLDTVV